MFSSLRRPELRYLEFRVRRLLSVGLLPQPRKSAVLSRLRCRILRLLLALPVSRILEPLTRSMRLHQTLMMRLPVTLGTLAIRLHWLRLLVGPRRLFLMIMVLTVLGLSRDGTMLLSVLSTHRLSV